MSTNIDEKYVDLSDYLSSNFTEHSDIFLVFANYLLVILNQIVDEGLSKYSAEDLLNYNYVLEYIRYNPRDSVLLLAQTIHSLLFLYKQFKT